MGVDGNQSKAEQIIQQLNAANAKKVALLMVLGFIIYHGLIHLRFGKFLILVSNIINDLFVTQDFTIYLLNI